MQVPNDEPRAWTEEDIIQKHKVYMYTKKTMQMITAIKLVGGWNACTTNSQIT